VVAAVLHRPLEMLQVEMRVNTHQMVLVELVIMLQVVVEVVQVLLVQEEMPLNLLVEDLVEQDYNQV
tara:strand:+ start:134 stop:334 length:201 start_codon:yes stop_codon:yes gene_type:complete